MDRLKQVKQTIKDAVFPRFCIQCKKEGSLLCEECFVLWQPGKMQIVEKDTHLHSWQYADPIVRQLICAWKYHYDQSAWEIIKARLRPELVALQHFVQIHNIEAIVPAPLHKWRACERGFDQAVMIAEFLSEELGIPVANLLERKISTGHQAEREVRERIESMKNSPFKICKNNPLQLPLRKGEGLELDSPPYEGGVRGGYVPDSILLIDDVWTTGATINAAARVLDQNGIEKIWKYTLAKG